MAQFEAVRQAKTLYRSNLMSRPNVVGVGIGYKTRGRSATDELSVVVLVRRKLPAAALAETALIPQELAGVRTDVIEVGDLRPLTDLRPQTDLQLTAGLRPQTGPAAPPAQQGRWRPAPGGVSLGHYQITAGTLGCIVRDKRTGERLILSNNHVLANSNNARPGDPVLQPGPADGGSPEQDTIALLVRFYPLGYAAAPATCRVAQSYASFGNFLARLAGSRHQLQAMQVRPTIFSLIDAAVARPLQDSDVLEENLEIGPIYGTVQAELGMAVCKSGRTTGFTSGKVSVLDATVSVNYGLGTAVVFEHQIITTPLSQGGDSGSLLVTNDSHRAVGLLFAGSEQATLHNPIKKVLELLNVELPRRPQSKNPGPRPDMERAEAVRAAYQEMLLAKANVTGVGVGLRETGGSPTGQVGLVVLVQRKLPKHLLAPADIIPSEIDGIPVDVRETGEFTVNQ